MEIPIGLFFSAEHEWVRVGEDGVTATIGITEYAQDQLGDIVYLDLPVVDTIVAQFEKMGEVESVKAVSDLFCPVSGEVVEVNQATIDNPEIVNNEPYRNGWLIRIRLSDINELEKLLSPKAYENLITSEIREQENA